MSNTGEILDLDDCSVDSTDYHCEHGCVDYCFDCAEFDVGSDDDSDDSELF